ncbi:MAG: hypothetical protein JKX97_09125, partial [Candidatus Lindowbacteria bacterium]|nr:hypothetical protein [Candidatus Lindowbacteria bacterium]
MRKRFINIQIQIMSSRQLYKRSQQLKSIIAEYAGRRVIVATRGEDGVAREARVLVGLTPTKGHRATFIDNDNEEHSIAIDSILDIWPDKESGRHPQRRRTREAAAPADDEDV